MTKPQPAISIDVDVTSPGHFFSCCGLLELASMLDNHALAWFEKDTFLLTGEIENLLPGFRNARFRQVSLSPAALRLRNGKTPKNPSTIEPVEIAIDGSHTLTLDWWLRPSEHNGLKLWSGSNSVAALVQDAFCAIRQDCSENILTTTIQLPRQPFFYAAVRPLHEREFGVSMDKIGREFEHLPYVELLTLVGLQRFRPARTPTGYFRYFTWASPIPINIAAAVAAGAIDFLRTECFEFPVIDRDDNGHKQFSRAERRPHVGSGKVRLPAQG